MKSEILGVKAPENTCTDGKCPFHGNISVKNEVLTGTVVKKDVNRSATIEWFKSSYVPKYERYEMRRRKMRVHNPACLDAPVGEKVLIARTRPLSKTKHHVIIEKQGFVGVSAVAEPVLEKKKTAPIKSKSHSEHKGDTP